MRTIDQAGDLKGKVIFMRADFDVPVGGDGTITETFRIERQRPMLAALVGAGARVIVGAHITAVPSFAPLLAQLQRHLNLQIRFCKDASEQREFRADGGSIALLENLRTRPGEEANDAGYAKEITEGCALYVNNAFAVCHREHASVSAAAQLMPSYAGTLVVEEVSNLSRILDAPADGKVIFMGGAKASTKIPVIKNLIDKAEHIAVGGRVAIELPEPIDPRIVMPVDYVDENLDIGLETSATFAALAAGARMIIWNGPMGKFEDPRYLAGTRAVADAIASSHAFSVVGGGDTIAAVEKLGHQLNSFGFVSTGGGAMLAFLAGASMPGLAALGYTPTT